MERGEETSTLLGKLAMAFYEYGVAIHCDTLRNVLDKKGAYCEHGVSLEKVVAAASRYWAHHDPALQHAIASAFLGPDDVSLLEAAPALATV